METPEGPPPLCRELWGPREVARYRGGPRGGLQRLVPAGGGARLGLRRALARVLLPQGYPESVSPDYLRYQCWDGLQALCSTLAGAFATRAVLQAVGVGDGAATVTGATINWVLRDGLGIVTRITFTYFQGSRLDCEAKQWRLAADLLNDLGLLLELLAPGWPRAAPVLLALGGAAKCVVGVAGGATRVALAAHQARRDNMADVAAKDGSQETLVNGVGLLLALLLLPLLDGRPWLCRGVLGGLLCTHLWANVGAVGSLRLLGLNRPRLRLTLRRALRGGRPQTPPHPDPHPGGGGGGGGVTLSVPGPDDVNPREPLLPGLGSRLRLHLGAPLHRLAHSEAEFRKALECGTPDYIIVLRPSQGWVGVGLRRGAPPGVLLGACAHALLLEELLGPELPPGAPMGAALRPLQRSLRRCPPGTVPWGVLAETSRVWRTLGPAFLRGLEEAGWETRRHLLAPDEWELDWGGATQPVVQ